jgi:hypothetical protein
MRMARAFIASVPLAVVLVAAVIVPVAVTPGTFGFKSWPMSPREKVTDRPVRSEARAVEVVKATAEGPGFSRAAAAVSKHRRPAAKRATNGSARPDRQTANLVMTPAPREPARDGSGRDGSQGGADGDGPGNGSALPVPGNAGTPSTPSSEPEPQPQPGPAAQPDPGQVAEADPPVLRPDPVPTPAPPAPVTPVLPAPPSPSDDGDDCDRGDRRRGPVRDIVHGLGIGRHRGLGFGHGRGHR